MIKNDSQNSSIETTYEVTKSPSYSGLKSLHRNFLSFLKDPLYLFPILDTQTQDSEAKALISSKIVTYPRNSNISQSLFLLHSSSPFKRILKSPDSVKFNFSNEAPVNSFITNTDPVFEVAQDEASTSYFPIPHTSQRSLTPSSELQTPIIDSSAIREIKGIHLKFVTNADEGIFRSITPENSFQSESLAEKHLHSKYNQSSFSRFSQTSGVFNDLGENWGSIISPRPSDADEMFIKSIVKGLEETNEDFSSFVEEGTVQLVRDFIPVESSASKNLLSSLKRPEVDLPNPYSPILRKMVICEEDEFNESVLKIISSICFTGFRNALSLEYSNIDAVTKAKADNTRDVYLSKCLFTEKIVYFLAKSEVVYISSGFEHCALLTVQGKVMTWGYGSSGALGHGSTQTLAFPTEIIDLPSIAYIECGGHHTLAISSDHEVFMWGRGEVHQLGIQNRQLCKDEMGYVALRPLKVSYFSSKSIKAKSGACGESHSLVLDTEGKIHAFGWGELGQLGVERKYLSHQMRTNEITPVNLIPCKVIKVSAGLAFSAAVCECGHVWVWGLGNSGQLGSAVNKLEHPSKVHSIENEFIVDVVCGENYVIAVTVNGKSFGWGLGKTGIYSHWEKGVPAGIEFISSHPRVLGETDVVHHFVIGGISRKVLSSLEYKSLCRAIEKK